MDGREELWSGICFLSFCETSGELFGEFCFAATANLLEIQIPEICIGILYSFHFFVELTFVVMFEFPTNVFSSTISF